MFSGGGKIQIGDGTIGKTRAGDHFREVTKMVGGIFGWDDSKAKRAEMSETERYVSYTVQNRRFVIYYD